MRFIVDEKITSVFHVQSSVKCQEKKHHERLRYLDRLDVYHLVLGISNKMTHDTSKACDTYAYLGGHLSQHLLFVIPRLLGFRRYCLRVMSNYRISMEDSSSNTPPQQSTISEETYVIPTHPRVEHFTFTFLTGARQKGK